ncbi:PTS sugar transporter subunit IIB [Enterococcus casseliflavus]|uniref:PTS sugar transporter subunit IIB n=1 Tax=Enterococcus casseliflavus TaxID=37734 RepID=UPI0039A69114
MTNLKILLCCGAGMSSGFLASNARKTAKKRKLSLNVEARSYTEVNDYLSSTDILMIGPHYASELSKYEALASPYNVPVVVIPQDVYAQLNGEKLLDIALHKINERKS